MEWDWTHGEVKGLENSQAWECFQEQELNEPQTASGETVFQSFFYQKQEELEQTV